MSRKILSLLLIFTFAPGCIMGKGSQSPTKFLIVDSVIIAGGMAALYESSGPDGSIAESVLLSGLGVALVATGIAGIAGTLYNRSNYLNTYRNGNMVNAYPFGHDIDEPSEENFKTIVNTSTETKGLPLPSFKNRFELGMRSRSF